MTIDYQKAGENVLNIIAEYSKQINKLKWKHIHKEIKAIEVVDYNPRSSPETQMTTYYRIDSKTGKLIDTSYIYLKTLRELRIRNFWCTKSYDKRITNY